MSQRWEPKGGISSIWFDGWTMLGPLFNKPSEVLTYYTVTDIEVFLTANGWDYKIINNYLPGNIMEYVQQNSNYWRHEDHDGLKKFRKIPSEKCIGVAKKEKGWI